MVIYKPMVRRSVVTLAMSRDEYTMTALHSLVDALEEFDYAPNRGRLDDAIDRNSSP